MEKEYLERFNEKSESSRETDIYVTKKFRKK